MQLTSNAIITCAPGNVVTIAGTSLGTSGTLTLSRQGGLKTTVLILPSNSWTATAISFTIPDGLTSDTLVIDNGSANVSVGLRVVSQYVTTAEYTASGEGIDLSDLVTGELDAVIQKASAYADTAIGFPIRLLQSNENYRWEHGSRRLYPRRWPIQSVDGLKVIVANSLAASFNSTDIVVDSDNRYCEVLAYAVANFVLFGAIENLGLSANIAQLLYTHGFDQLHYPDRLREAVIMIATELLTYRKIQAQGMGGFSMVKQGNEQFQRRSEAFSVPQTALDMLQPFRTLRLA